MSIWDELGISPPSDGPLQAEAFLRVEGNDLEYDRCFHCSQCGAHMLEVIWNPLIASDVRRTTIYGFADAVAKALGHCGRCGLELGEAPLV